MTSRQAAHACRRAGASAVPASKRVRLAHAPGVLVRRICTVLMGAPPDSGSAHVTSP